MPVKAILFVFSFIVFFLQAAPGVPAQSRPVYRFADVKSIFIDRDGFTATATSCGQNYVGRYLTCDAADKKLNKFLETLERWLGKYGIKVTSDRDSADAVLKGTVFIDDDIGKRMQERQTAIGLGRSREERASLSHYDEVWTVNSTLENNLGNLLWKSGNPSPKISYSSSSIEKIKGKELAKEIQYNLKRAR
jgi:hypothetical protein